MNAERKIAIPVISAEAEKLYQKLITMEPGESISYREMSQIIDAEILRNRSIIYTAKRKAKHDYGIVFVTIRCEGIRRAQGVDYIGIARSGVVRSRRIANKSLKESLMMPQDEFTSLQDEDKIRINTDRTVCATLAHFSGSKVVRKLHEEVKVQNTRLNIGRVLELCE